MTHLSGRGRLGAIGMTEESKIEDLVPRGQQLLEEAYQRGFRDGAEAAKTRLIIRSRCLPMGPIRLIRSSHPLPSVNEWDWKAIRACAAHRVPNFENASGRHAHRDAELCKGTQREHYVRRCPLEARFVASTGSPIGGAASVRI